MEKEKESYFENEHVRIWLEDRILFFVYQPELQIDLTIAKQTVQDRLKISDGITRPVLADIRDLKHVENDARDYLASTEAGQNISSLAVLTKTPIQNLFANFYFKLSKPPMPTQLFTDQGKALRWLKLFTQMN
jgi:hypothetical protein